MGSTRSVDVQAAQVVLGSQYEEVYDVQSELNPAHKGQVAMSLPTGRDQLEIGVIQHRLRKGVPLAELDEVSGSTAIMLAVLSVVVRRAPEWWYRTVGEGKSAERVPAPEELHDMDMLWDLYGRYTALRATFPRQTGDAGGSPPTA
ncbi:MAG: hypothetical protein Q7U76_13090 [Nitrospirota bacterium]|nr:hypothetical protein [Nitrospirota bacterium]